MATPIAPTPKLGKRASKKFLRQVCANVSKKSRPILTPKIDSAIEAFMKDVCRNEKSTS